jgi:adenylate cyclase
MVARVLESGGGVDKFLGDGILAVWGSLARRDAATEASSALSCARAMKGALVGFNEQRAAAGLQPWKIGIGIHSGDVLFGNIGSEARMEPTVIGDTVNLASRIEGLTKSLGVEILFSVSTAELAAVAGDARSADRVRVIGRKAPVDLFTFWPDEFHAADRTAHEAAIAAYREGRFADAIRAFEDVLSRHPEDGLARILAARSAELLAAPPEGLWEGVFVARSK